LQGRSGGKNCLQETDTKIEGRGLDVTKKREEVHNASALGQGLKNLQKRGRALQEKKARRGQKDDWDANGTCVCAERSGKDRQGLLIRKGKPGASVREAIVTESP